MTEFWKTWKLQDLCKNQSKSPISVMSRKDFGTCIPQRGTTMESWFMVWDPICDNLFTTEKKVPFFSQDICKSLSLSHI
jgi:hypothetical protein